MANPFVFACITPHGLPIIDKLAGENQGLMERTRSSMVQLGTWMADAHPETIVVLTPHGLRIDGQFAVVNSSYMSGQMSERTVAEMVGQEVEEDGVTVRFNRLVDRELAQGITSAAMKASLPVASVNFATNQGIFSHVPLDWGVMVPLYFMPEVPIVVISPARQLSNAEHIRFGEVIAEAVKASGKRVGLIASCDWSHAHDSAGPYGYHQDAGLLDQAVVTLLKNNEIEKMSEFGDDFINHAKPDGIWQALILAGAISKHDRNSSFLSYEVPTYFGMMCVAYR